MAKAKFTKAWRAFQRFQDRWALKGWPTINKTFCMAYRIGYRAALRSKSNPDGK